MSSDLFITACIPTYRRPEKFHRALDSVMKQSALPSQIVVGDDGAQDEVRYICESYKDRRILYFPRTPKVRMTENWDFVMRWPQHGLVALLEDDNFWHPQHIEHALEMFQRNPAISICHSGHAEAWDRNHVLEYYKQYVPPWHTKVYYGNDAVIPMLDIVLDALLCGSINSSTVVLRREILEEVPCFDSRYLMGMDTLMWTRIAMKSICAYYPGIDVTYTYHGANVSNDMIRFRKAGRQARASRRTIANEALHAGILSLAKFREWLMTLAPTQAAGVITLSAHHEMDAGLRSAAKDVWIARPELRQTTGYLRASGLLGFDVLQHVDVFDTALGFSSLLKSRLESSRAA